MDQNRHVVCRMSSWRMQQSRMMSNGFSLQTLKRHPGVVPIVAIIGGVCVFVTTTCIYFAAKKMDVQFVGKQGEWERMDLNKPEYRKLFRFKQEVKPMPELQALLNEINEK